MKRVIYHRGKRVAQKKINKKKVVGLILIIVIIVFMVVNAYGKNENEENNNVETLSQVTNNTQETNSISEGEKEKKYENVDIPESLGGYNVLGQLVIEKIDVRQNILSKTENDSLKLGVTKFYGPKINEPGNFCICGHNWNNILKRLDEMDIGDQFYVITRETKERIDYEIYNKYSCEPTDLSCLNQNQDGNKEVTLITCNPGGLTRLICKAREV